MADDLLPRPPHPLEALIAKLISPDRGEAWAQYRKEMYERRVNRALDVLDGAAAASGLTSPELLERIQADERRSDLLEVTLTAASKTTSQDKLRALARVLAAGITADSDTKVDASFVLGRIVDEMDPPHIRALALIAELGGFNPGLATGGADSFGRWLQEAFPGLGEVSNQVGAFLVGNGLVTNPFYANGVLSMTALGRMVLDLVTASSGPAANPTQ